MSTPKERLAEAKQEVKDMIKSRPENKEEWRVRRDRLVKLEKEAEEFMKEAELDDDDIEALEFLRNNVQYQLLQAQREAAPDIVIEEY